jgi:LPXTG-motif cell wall-anchored protein
MAAALTLAGVGTASAHDRGGEGHCGPVQLQYSTDGGHWTKSDWMRSAPTSVEVKLTGKATKGCSYPVSLATYKTEGSSWETSGTQTFLGVDQATLSKEKPRATLQVKGLDKTVCNGQIDLYGNNKVYDGNNGTKLPHFPDSTSPENLISHWNGEFEDCNKGGESMPPAPGGGDDNNTTPPTGGDDSTPPSDENTTPPAEGGSDVTPTPTASTPASGTPSASASPSSSAPAGGGAGPSGTPVAQPVSDTPVLAETGSDSSQTTTFVAAGAALVVIGAGAVVFTRRRNRTQA